MKVEIGRTYKRKGWKGSDTFWDRHVRGVSKDSVYYAQKQDANFEAVGICSLQHFKRIMEGERQTTPE